MLASLTSSVVLPAEGGEGPVRMSAVVNVHRDARAAEWEMAGTIEDAQRCPRQQLRSDERIEGLLSFGQGYGVLNNTGTEDTLTEHGEFHSDTLGGPYYFGWTRARIGPVTVAVSARGAPGWDRQELTGVMTQAQAVMIMAITRELGADADAGPADRAAGEGDDS
jgi:hypothetical protein